MRSIQTGLLSLTLTASLSAQLELAPVFGDHMVLQRGQDVLLWGRGPAGETLDLSMSSSKAQARVGADGRWQAELSALPVGGPYELLIEGSETLRVRDVLVGEVWLCSGQSNMEWPLRRSDGAEDFIAQAKDPQLRVLEVARHASAGPVRTIRGEWQVCSPDAVAEFSAVAYHFGMELRAQLGVPVGLVQAAWGGTPAEAWTSRRALSAEPGLLSRVIRDAESSARLSMARARASFEGAEAPAGMRAASRPAYLYNGMIAPLLPLRLRGVIWYQGENNAGRHVEYRDLFPCMIRNWREDFGQGDFPFLFVQLANWARGEGWPELREAQTMTLSEPNTAMAVTIDIGDAEDIHPRNKQDVGLRLALAARAIAYGEDVLHSGPSLDTWKSEGHVLRLSFKHAPGGFRVLGDSIQGFEIAGKTGEFVSADARIDGGDILLSSDAVPAPTRARYGWKPNPVCNLYNKEGLPAQPFRTDGPELPKQNSR
ncbi:MAG: sialate O-acetylesterase [Planctomycetota bacterium]|jgi:sialate O-acetylesterase